MNGIKSIRRREYDSLKPIDVYGSSIEVTVVLDGEDGRKRQHLIEDRIDKLFDEADAIMDTTASERERGNGER